MHDRVKEESKRSALQISIRPVSKTSALVALLTFCLILIFLSYAFGNEINDYMKVVFYLVIIFIPFFCGWIFVKHISSGVRRAPGAQLLLLAEFLYAPKTVDHVFHPLIADMRTEYFDAVRNRNLWKARWLALRYYYAFAKASALLGVYRNVNVRSLSKKNEDQ